MLLSFKKFNLCFLLTSLNLSPFGARCLHGHGHQLMVFLLIGLEQARPLKGEVAKTHRTFVAYAIRPPLPSPEPFIHDWHPGCFYYRMMRGNM